MNGLEQKQIWDKVTRLWHWALASSVIIGWLLGRFRDFETVQWHFYAGYITGVLLLWRLIWGFVGPQPVRYSSLFKSIAGIGPYLANFLRRSPSGIAGHNPLGAISTFVMLALLLAQASSGLFVEDDTLFAAGPLAYDIDPELAKELITFHRINARLILAVVGLHLGAILFYWLWKKENLVMPMLTGRKWVKKTGSDA